MDIDIDMHVDIESDTAYSEKLPSSFCVGSEDGHIQNFWLLAAKRLADIRACVYAHLYVCTHESMDTDTCVHCVHTCDYAYMHIAYMHVYVYNVNQSLHTCLV